VKVLGRRVVASLLFLPIAVSRLKPTQRLFAAPPNAV